MTGRTCALSAALAGGSSFLSSGICRISPDQSTAGCVSSSPDCAWALDGCAATQASQSAKAAASAGSSQPEQPADRWLIADPLPPPPPPNRNQPPAATS